MLMWNLKISVSKLGPKDLFSPLYHLCRVCCSPSLLVVLQLWALKWVGVLSLEGGGRGPRPGWKKSSEKWVSGKFRFASA